MTQTKPTTLYKLKLFLLMLVGYCYIFLMPVIFLALLGLFLWTIVTGKGLDGPLIYIEIVLLIMAGKFVQSLWIKVTVPEFRSLPLDEKKTPKLVETIREIRRAIHGPQVHKVILSDKFDITLTPVPRLGLFGWPRYKLEIGMPLMHGLTPAQFRAQLTHEMGHFSGISLGAWIYYLREVWVRTRWRLEVQRRLGSWLFNRFFSRYVDYFRNYSLPLVQSREYEADRLAAEITTPEVTADALIRFAYGEQLFDQYWTEFYEDSSVVVPQAIRFAETAKALRSEVENQEVLRYLEELLAEESRDFHVHPALKYRLKELGQEARLPTPISESAADVYFADALNELTRQLENTWEPRAEPPGADQQAFWASIATGEEFRRIYNNASTERTEVSFVDSFTSHDLPEREVEQLRFELAKHPRIRETYLVRKGVEYLPEKPLYVMGLVFDRRWSDEDLDFTRRFLRARTSPRELYSFVLDHRNRRVGKLIRNVSNSLIYRRVD